jgi:hypothetical protein
MRFAPGRIVVRLATNPAAEMARLTARLSRAFARESARTRGFVQRSFSRGTRYTALALAVGLGLNGLGFCLCATGPAQTAAADPRSCCPNRTGHHTHTPAAETILKRSASCCDSPTAAPAFVARIDERDGLRHALIIVAATHIPPDAPLAPSTRGASASCVRGASPSRTPVLRI